MNLLMKQEQIHCHREQTCVCQGQGEGGLENPRDWGAWSAAVYGGRTESDTTEVT